MNAKRQGDANLPTAWQLLGKYLAGLPPNRPVKLSDLHRQLTDDGRDVRPDTLRAILNRDKSTLQTGRGTWTLTKPPKPTSALKA